MLVDFTTLKELLGLKIALISNPRDMICIMSLEYFLNENDYDYTELKSFVENENLESEDVYILEFAVTTDKNDIWEDILDLEYEVIIEFNLVDFIGQKKQLILTVFAYIDEGNIERPYVKLWEQNQMDFRRLKNWVQSVAKTIKYTFNIKNNENTAMIDNKDRKQEFYVIIERDEDGYFVGEVPQLKACYSQGKTIDELMTNMKEVIELCLEEEQERSSSQFVGVHKLVI